MIVSPKVMLNFSVMVDDWPQVPGYQDEEARVQGRVQQAPGAVRDGLHGQDLRAHQS
jgi:hypothetical protein